MVFSVERLVLFLEVEVHLLDLHLRGLGLMDQQGLAADLLLHSEGEYTVEDQDLRQIVGFSVGDDDLLTGDKSAKFITTY